MEQRDCFFFFFWFLEGGFLLLAVVSLFLAGLASPSKSRDTRDQTPEHKPARGTPSLAPESSYL